MSDKRYGETFTGMKKYLERLAVRYKAQIFWADSHLSDVTEIHVDRDGDIFTKSRESGRWTVWVGKCGPSAVLAKERR